VFNYSNSNFVYLALVASKVEKKSYDKIVKQRILRKLRMNHTYFPLQLKKSYLPVSYAVVEGNEYQPDVTNYSLNLLSSLIGAGEICSTVIDMDHFFQGISNGELLTKKEYHTLFHPNKSITYSAGLSLKESNEGYRSSSGLFEGEGISSYYESDEKGDEATIILTNMHSIGIYDLGDLFYQVTSKN
jgi:CubicO group peptidase (beta-lactamase class C family)